MKTQLIRCKCNAIIAASHEPNCYTDIDWIMNLRQDVLNNGCTVEYVDDANSFKFESCICENKRWRYSTMDDVYIGDNNIPDNVLISEITYRYQRNLLSGYDVTEILRVFDAIRNDDVPDTQIDVLTIIDELKLEHLKNIFNKYSLEEIESKLPC